MVASLSRKDPRSVSSQNTAFVALSPGPLRVGGGRGRLIWIVGAFILNRKGAKGAKGNFMLASDC